MQSFLFNPFILGFVGINGIRLAPDGGSIYVTVTADPFNRGVLYTLPLVESPRQDDLVLFHEFAAGETPDGIAFGASGRLYAVINGDDPKIIALNPDGTEYSRVTSPLFSSPANAAFDGAGSLLVVNHPISAGRKDPALFKILKVYVNDIAHPLITPEIP
jgi:sugar lactone lactonase YvrE